MAIRGGLDVVRATWGGGGGGLIHRDIRYVQGADLNTCVYLLNEQIGSRVPFVISIPITELHTNV